uniref:RRM domain-containing protein n=1 Tax=viral metagenome TaxID=1070528 RepID=A0A6C0E8X8_9ZZZZ
MATKPRDYYYYPHDGIKIEVHHVNIDGVFYKVTREYIVQKYSKSIADKIRERQKWKKFGDDDDHHATIGDEVFFEFNPNLMKVHFKDPKEYEYYYFDEMPLKNNNIEEEILIEKEKTKDMFGSSKKSTLKCRLCGGPHWSIKCNQNKKNTSRNDVDIKSDYKKTEFKPKREVSPIKVDDLDKTVSGDDVRYYLEEYGAIKNFHLVKDKRTGESAGYCFVTYYNQEDAEYALKNISKKPIGYAYPSCEWSSPRPSNN